MPLLVATLTPLAKVIPLVAGTSTIFLALLGGFAGGPLDVLFVEWGC